MTHRITIRKRCLIGVVAAGLLLPTMAISAPGGLDQSFSGDGKLTHHVGTGNNAATDVVTYGNGSIVTIGSAMDGSDRVVSLSKFTENGTPDDDFGDGGSVSLPLGGSTLDFRDAIIRQGQKLVIAGTALPSNGDAFIGRRLVDGAPDPTFGTEEGQTVHSFGEDDGFRSVVRQPDGKYVAGGYVCDETCDFLVARFNSDGTLDTNLDDDPAVHFSQNGWTQTDFGIGGDQIEDLALQEDGRIVAVGEALGETVDGQERNFGVARYHPNGQLDNNFSGDGRHTIDLGDDDEAEAVAVAGNRIFIGGTSETTTEPQVPDFAFVSLKGSGDFNDDFSGDGKRKVLLNGAHGYLTDMTLQRDGKIVAVGAPPVDTRFALVRLLPSGKLDLAFGQDGVKKTEVAPNSFANAVTIDADDRIVAAGHAFDGDFDLALARFKS